METPRLSLRQRIGLWMLCAPFPPGRRPICDVPLVGNRLMKLAFWLSRD